MEDLVNRLTVSFLGVLASWGLMDISLILACIASVGTIIHTALGIKKLIDEQKKRKSD
jgi:energy-converting hydrogenase Eha subunit C